MSETVKFTCDQNNPSRSFELQVTTKFFSDHKELTVEQAEKLDLFTLLGEPYSLGTYLHNESGPALATLKKNAEGRPLHMEFWLNGNRVQKEQAKKMEHDMDFGNEVQRIIND